MSNDNSHVMHLNNADNNYKEVMEMEPRTDVVVKLTERDGNAFAVLGAVTKALRDAGYTEIAQQYFDEATSGDYDHLLQVVQTYVIVE